MLCSAASTLFVLPVLQFGLGPCTQTALSPTASAFNPHGLQLGPLHSFHQIGRLARNKPAIGHRTRGLPAQGSLKLSAQLGTAGLDAEADAVGPGIFGGSAPTGTGLITCDDGELRCPDRCVERDENGQIIIGKQFQEHNSLPGPVYSGQGYTEMSLAIQKSPEAVSALLQTAPHMVNEITTGGARPLHVCGMSQQGQYAAPVLIEALRASGLDPSFELEVTDTWGYTPLQRMATNNLAVGADCLVRAGASHTRPSGVEGTGDSARQLARRLRSYAVLKVFQQYELENGIPLPDGEPLL